MSLRLIGFLLLLLPSVCYAQEGMEVGMAAASPVLSEMSVGDAMVRYAQLQSGLDSVVYTFDERARQVAKHTREFEPWFLNARLHRFLNPDVPQSKMTFTEQARYDLLIREPTLCFELDEALKQYVSAHRMTLDSVVQTLVKATGSLDDASRGVFAEKLRTVMASHRPYKTRVQEILYQCLYKNKNDMQMPRDYSVEKTMRSWFVIQEPLLNVWIGNVD